MSIAIDQNACIGCGKCHDVCPGTLIHLNADRKAFIKYPIVVERSLHPCRNANLPCFGCGTSP